MLKMLNWGIEKGKWNLKVVGRVLVRLRSPQATRPYADLNIYKYLSISTSINFRLIRD